MNDKKTKNDGRRFFIYLILFFMTFASVDAFFVYKAMTTYTGVVDQTHGK
jgi:nitrogen fixation protein FixH